LRLDALLAATKGFPGDYICLLRDGDLILGHFEELEEQEEYSPRY
jgi:hypothetical protein